jgi:hypothetical protein
MHLRLWWGLAESVFGGSLKIGGQFCAGVFCMNLASVTTKMFSHLIYSIKTFYKFCTANVICKENAAINYNTVQHRKSSFPLTLTGHTATVHFIMFFLQVSQK